MKMKPLMIRAFGRTGTTLMMQLLNTSNDVFVPNGYPYESRFLSYLARLAQVPTSLTSEYPKDYIWDDGKVNQGIPSLIGNFPYQHDDFLNAKRTSARFLTALWNQFSDEVELSKEKSFSYYAEKVSLDAAPFISSALNDSRNLYIVRDPRGELASIYSFNQKRGFNGFGWLDSDDLHSYSDRMISSRKFFLQNVKSFYKKPDESNFVARYEDLACDLGAVSSDLSEWLGIELSACDVLDSQDTFSHHMTNSNVVSSIDSWREKLPSEIIDKLTTSLLDELRFFGYEK